PSRGEGAAFLTVVETQLDVLERILAIEHDACRASALHGLGHLIESWGESHPGFEAQRARAERAIDAFLARESSGLRAELAEYARAARAAQIQ
ncbi:MAG: hypothetical protein AAFZ65_07395, partial [Planctomycetota bacterium]